MNSQANLRILTDYKAVVKAKLTGDDRQGIE
jgi:hypothetical protein